MPRNSSLAQDVWKDAGQNVCFSVLALRRENREKEVEAIRSFASSFQAIGRSLKIRAIDGNLKMALGFSAAGWAYLFPDAPVPQELVTFETMKGETPEAVMPGTPGDIFIHVRSNSSAVVFEAMYQFHRLLKDVTTVLDETKGFRYFEGRAIIGFIDGTEAPVDQESIECALIGDEDPIFTNGSYAFAQKWVHDMEKWEGLSTEIQEKAIGRRKFSDIELDDEDKYENAHTVASKFEVDGEEKKIIRMNVPYKDTKTGDIGTYFMGYSGSWAVTKGMIENMLSKNDYLLTFSHIETGQLFFIPSIPILDALADGSL